MTRNNDASKLPRVSIIIPVYNGEDYVSLAIECALNQTYSNLEIIVVNDGSTDSTDEICKKYGDKIKYICKKNGGVSTALNLGIENMTGDYFSWLSHDDLYYANKIEVEINYLIENNLIDKNVILYSDYSLIDEYGRLSCDIELNSRYLNRNSAYAMLFGSIDGLSLLIPKKAFDEVGVFDTTLKCVQDYQLWFDMFEKGYEFRHVPEITVCTRVHAKQVTNTNPKMTAEGNNYWINVLKYFNDKEKIKLFGSVFNYWFILHSFFDGGPYKDVINLCKEEYSKIIDSNKKEKPKVSVIVNLNSSYSNNVECLKSLLSQTYDNVEYIIYTKDKKDYKILNEFEDNSYKLIYTDKSDASIWNEGIKESTGKYISFLEGNSCYAEEKLEKQVLMMLCSENMMVYSSYNRNSQLIDVGFNNWQIDDLSRETLDINLSTVMLDRKAIIKNKLLFDENVDFGADIIFIMNVLKHGYPLGIRSALVLVKENDKNNDESINNAVDYLIKEHRLKIPEDKDKMSFIYDFKNSVDLKKIRLSDLDKYKLKIKNESLWKKIIRKLFRRR